MKIALASEVGICGVPFLDIHIPRLCAAMTCQMALTLCTSLSGPTKSSALSGNFSPVHHALMNLVNGSAEAMALDRTLVVAPPTIVHQGLSPLSNCWSCSNPWEP